MLISKVQLKQFYSTPMALVISLARWSGKRSFFLNDDDIVVCTRLLFLVVPVNVQTRVVSLQMRQHVRRVSKYIPDRCSAVSAHCFCLVNLFISIFVFYPETKVFPNGGLKVCGWVFRFVRLTCHVVKMRECAVQSESGDLRDSVHHSIMSVGELDILNGSARKNGIKIKQNKIK